MASIACFFCLSRCVAEPNNGCEVALALFIKITKDQTGRKDGAKRDHSMSSPFVFLVGLFLSFYLRVITLN